MSTATLQPAAGLSLAGPRQTQWIISRRQDLIWFIGSAVISYLALGAMSLGVGVALIQFIWFFGIDGPHVQSTITRTYFDKEERARLGWFLWIPVPLLLAGPLFVWAGYGSLFFLFAVCWQQFHIVKQHFGFMMLYKGKKQRPRRFSTGPLAAAELAIDSAGHVCAAHAAGDHPDLPAGGVAAEGGC